MQRVGSFRDVLDVAFELPAGADPYEQTDFRYAVDDQSEEELRKTWSVFTRLKGVVSNGRRLENASWRLWFRERSRSGLSVTPSADNLIPAAQDLSTMSEYEKFDTSINQSLAAAEEQTDRLRGDMFAGGVDDKFREDAERRAEVAKVESARELLQIADRHSLPDAALDDLLSWVHLALRSTTEAQDATATPEMLLPRSKAGALDSLAASRVAPRPKVAAFCHSLERNGANNFLLYLLRELREQLSFSLFSPKEGAMRADYEAMGISVSLVDAKSATYPADIRAILPPFSYAIANTIMTTEVINASHELDVPSLWVIHEAWPKGQFDYYAKEVFLMQHVDSVAITNAFSHASRIVFPAKVQRKCYEGLFEPHRAYVIYNGIPLASINTFRNLQSRARVRKELGYGPDDLLLVHMGTVCKRKGQIVTSKAFARLANEVILPEGKEWKLLMVGARYIRDHEIAYIEECKKVMANAGVEDLCTILDVHKNVLPFYLAADIVLCPSLNEVLPLVICEAMAFERPVIASRIDGIPEALTDGVEGLLIPPNDDQKLYDAINMLARDETLRLTMGRSGRQRVLQQFSFGAMSKSYRETIQLDLTIEGVVNASNLFLSSGTSGESGTATTVSVAA